MAAADVHPVWMCRAPTIVSMQQLEDVYVADGKAAAAQPLQCVARPEAPVAEAVGACLARYSFPALECKIHPPQKRVRSFGDLNNALVPNIEEGSDGWMDSLSGGSSDDGESVVPEMKGVARAAAAGDIVPLSKIAAQRGQMAAPLQMGLLDTLLRTEWDDRKDAGMFRYDVAACPSLMVPGAYGFIAQLNEGRASKKRPTEFRVDQVAQAFDAAKFNFTKALQKEVLVQFEPVLEKQPAYEARATVHGSPNLVYINVSPIEYGHVLLVPRVMDCLPQVVCPGSLLLALNFLKQVNNAYFRIGFNSLGAYGTINHLHFQAYYLASPFPIERAETAPVPGLRRASGAVTISQLSGYAVRGLVFEAKNSLGALAETVGAACRRLTDANVPHNLFIVDRGARIFLLPNAFAERKAKGTLPPEVLDTQVDPAAFELSGHLVLKRAADFEAVSEDLCWRLLECASLDEDHFMDVVCIALPREMRVTGRASLDVGRPSFDLGPRPAGSCACSHRASGCFDRAGCFDRGSRTPTGRASTTFMRL